MTASIGVVQKQRGRVLAGDLLRRADIAIYRAKVEGKARYVVFEEGMDTQALRRLDLENDLRRAIEAQEFVVHYQPQVTLESGDLTGLEALVRWEHPEKGLIHPIDFIPIAEDIGAVRELGLWVLEEACRQAMSWDSEGVLEQATVLSVNISPRQLDDPQIVARVAAALARTGFPANRLALEITESVLLSESRTIADKIAALRSLGIRIAIDDFGTGYASLTYLTRIPVDFLKIDQRFVSGLERDDESKSIVLALVNLSRWLEIEVIAEGVESRAQLSHLLALGCRQGQGFLFAKPLSADDARVYLENARKQLVA
ncbi:MAG: EAL domain-containing protein [Dehalococcoidia bacterium]|nr:EAL domain-containing protein [Dehalococcoidia bacterium]